MRENESGNVFFYIFLGVALLAALSFAIAHGSRSSVSSLSADKRRLAATEIISFGDVVGKTVTQLRLRGVAANALSFANPDLPAGSYGTYNTNPANEIFNPAGGAVVYTDPPREATTTGTEHYAFLANNEFLNIGTTAGNATSSDLILIVPNLKLEVCQQINDLIALTSATAAPPDDDDIDEGATFKPGANPFGYSETLGDDDPVLDGKNEGCLMETADTEYVYYKVLLSR